MIYREFMQPSTSPLFSPGGEAKCVRGQSVQGARRSAPNSLNNASVLEPYVEDGEQAQRRNGELIARSDRQLVRNAKLAPHDYLSRGLEGNEHLAPDGLSPNRCRVKARR